MDKAYRANAERAPFVNVLLPPPTLGGLYNVDYESTVQIKPIIQMLKGLHFSGLVLGPTPTPHPWRVT